MEMQSSSDPSTRVIVSEVIELPEECVEIYPKSKQVFHLQRLRYAIMRRWFWSIPSRNMSTFWISSWRISNSLPYDIFSQEISDWGCPVDRTVEARKAGQRSVRF